MLSKTKHTPPKWHALIKAIMIAVFLTVFLSYWDSYPYNTFHTPYKVTNNERLDTLSSPSYVILNTDALYYTGYDYEVKGQTKGSYYYTLLDDSCIFFLLEDAPSDLSGIWKNQTLTGKVLTDSTYVQTLISGISEDLGWDKAKLSDMVSPIIIDTTSNDMLFHNLYFGITCLCLVLLALCFILNIVRLLKPKDRQADYV